MSLPPAVQRLWSIVWVVVRTVLVVGVSYVILVPVLVKVCTSVMPENDLFDQTVRWIPRHLTLDNYRTVWEHMKYPRAFINSLSLASLVSLLQLASCTLIGYGFARFEFRFKEFWFAMVIFTLIVPPQMLMVPLYMNFRYFTLFGTIPEPGINLLGSFWPFIITSATGTGLRNGLFVFVMRQFFRGMPHNLEEAAYVDGAGPLTTFVRIMLPGATPATITVFLFAFVWQWNDSFFTRIFLGNRAVLPIMLTGLVRSVHQENPVTGQYASLINNTGSLMFMLPVLLLYAFMQRYFRESIERTGLVG